MKLLIKIKSKLRIFWAFQIVLLILFFSCNNIKDKKDIPVIGFLDFVEDATLAQARQGFINALEEGGFSEKSKTIKIIYRNAQGDIPTLVQACDYMLSKKVDLIATNPTLSTITATQKTEKIPVFMMVSPSPELAKLTNEYVNTPSNLAGVYETLSYIDTSLLLIKRIFPLAKKVGAIYNQSEPQSISAVERIRIQCANMNLELELQSINNSSETQLVVESLLNKEIDVFFALPDNVVFASFETIAKLCERKNIPVFTSEVGLVRRGALAAFGADMYQWGYQCGIQAAAFLKNKDKHAFKPEIVKVRKYVYNPRLAKKLNIKFDNYFHPLDKNIQQ